MSDEIQAWNSARDSAIEQMHNATSAALGETREAVERKIKRPKSLRWYIALWKCRLYSWWIFKGLGRGTREKPIGPGDMRYLMAFLRIDEEESTK